MKLAISKRDGGCGHVVWFFSLIEASGGS
jgi:hypothetical protein